MRGKIWITTSKSFKVCNMELPIFPAQPIVVFLQKDVAAHKRGPRCLSLECDLLTIHGRAVI